jgi:hypothetical protein
MHQIKAWPGLFWVDQLHIQRFSLGRNGAMGEQVSGSLVSLQGVLRGPQNLSPLSSLSQHCQSIVWQLLYLLPVNKIIPKWKEALKNFYSNFKGLLNTVKKES